MLVFTSFPLTRIEAWLWTKRLMYNERTERKGGLADVLDYSGSSCLVASLLYTIQIYADFAGYSLMALGVGKVLGFELTENFRRPYFAVSVTDFWHRWHISLSTWLKDYVYIPMGGSRCSKLRNYWNIFVTFLVSGIWHGANWTFIVWGCTFVPH